MICLYHKAGKKIVPQKYIAYEQELKKCRTKEDVQRLKLSRIGSSLATVKSIENNPHITQEKKLQMISLENAKCEKLERNTQATEAEKAKAEKELQAAEQAKRAPETEQAADQPKNEQTETAQDDSCSKAENDRLAIESDGGQVSPMPDTNRKRSTSVEPDSPEIRKVRRAKAKAAYVAVRTITDDGTSATLDVQA